MNRTIIKWYFATWLLAVAGNLTITAAEKVPAGQMQSGVANNNVNRALSLPPGNVLAAKAMITISPEIKKIRFQQFYQNVPVWNQSVAATRTNQGVLSQFSGNIIEGIGKDIDSIKPKLSREQVLDIALHKDVKLMTLTKKNTQHSKRLIENAQIKLWVVLDSNNRAMLAYIVSYMTHYPLPRRPFYMINANSGRVFKSWEGLTFSNDRNDAQVDGIGGNNKTGKKHYTRENSALQVSQKGTQCFLSNSDVDTIDMNQTSFGGSISQFECLEGRLKPVNGAFSPLNDAHFYASKVVDMYRDWYAIAPTQSKLKVRAHYGQGFENAFWDGYQVTFGDGGDNLYPLMSLDVTAHEISHGYSELNSNLVYSGESGAVNESFADISGEAAEFYLHGFNDWVVGADVKKASGGLRYFDQPKKDRVSIQHFSDFNNKLSVHQTAGIINHAFYRLANTKHWNTKKAFDVFMVANRVYWTAETSLVEAANSVCEAGKDYKYELQDIERAFAIVGINTSNCQIIDSNNTNKLLNGQAQSNLNGYQGYSQWFNIEVPEGARNLKITTFGGKGDVDLYVLLEQQPSLQQYDCRPFETANDETCLIPVSKGGSYEIMLYGQSAFSGVQLLAEYSEPCESCPIKGGVTFNSLAADYDQWVYKKIEVPEGMHTLSITLSNGNGDADLYVSRTKQPTDEIYDCRPQSWGNSEVCLFEKPVAGVWYVAVKAYARFERAKIDVKWQP
jgi:vibriolysin